MLNYDELRKMGLIDTYKYLRLADESLEREVQQTREILRTVQTLISLKLDEQYGYGFPQFLDSNINHYGDDMNIDKVIETWNDRDKDAPVESCKDCNFMWLS